MRRQKGGMKCSKGKPGGIRHTAVRTIASVYGTPAQPTELNAALSSVILNSSEQILVEKLHCLQVIIWEAQEKS